MWDVVIPARAQTLVRGFEERGFLTIAVWQAPGLGQLKLKLREFDRSPGD